MKTSPSIPTSAAIEELTKGREIALKLRVLLQEASEADGLIEEVLSSFSRAIDVLGLINYGGYDRSYLVCADEVGTGCCGKKRKSSAVGRGGFRKRKQTSEWRTVISKTCTDDYSWRKYGQKDIQSSKFPRSYFRCTHKYDQGCQATKQVQISENDPTHFLMTYMGEHSCKIPDIIPTIILQNNSIEPSAIVFGSKSANITQENPLPSSPLFSKIQENDEVIRKSLTPVNASAEYFDLTDFDEISGLNSPTSTSDMSSMEDYTFKFEDDMFSFNQFGDINLSWEEIM